MNETIQLLCDSRQPEGAAGLAAPHGSVSNNPRYTMTIKTICRYNPVARHATIIRLTYAEGQKQCSIGVRPKLWEVHRESCGTIYTILGIRVHFKASYGGRFAD